MGTLYVVATPIGNREDITIRAIKTLMAVPVIACEDTRRTGQLLNYYREQYRDMLSMFRNIDKQQKPRLISFYDEVEEQKTPEIIALLQSGKDVALVSDAGTPLISDPGFKLVRECRRKNIPVSPIPGPSSIIAVLSVAGLPTDRFLFVGYLPLKKNKRDELLRQIKHMKEQETVKTVVMFESPYRITKTVTYLRNAFGGIPVVLAREMTKLHEEFVCGNLDTLVSSAPSERGEIVIIF